MPSLSLCPLASPTAPRSFASHTHPVLRFQLKVNTLENRWPCRYSARFLLVPPCQCPFRLQKVLYWRQYLPGQLFHQILHFALSIPAHLRLLRLLLLGTMVLIRLQTDLMLLVTSRGCWIAYIPCVIGHHHAQSLVKCANQSFLSNFCILQSYTMS